MNNEIDESSPITWLAYYPKLSLMKYTKQLHMGSGSDIILWSCE